MGSADGFSASKRSRNHFPRSPDYRCSLFLLYSPATHRMSTFDSIHGFFIQVVATNQRSYGQIEAIAGFSASKRSKSAFLEVLIVVRGGGGGVHKSTRNLRKSTSTFIVAQQPEALWTNGDDRRI